jgi:hypothetical protein
VALQCPQQALRLEPGQSLVPRHNPRPRDPLLEIEHVQEVLQSLAR